MNAAIFVLFAFLVVSPIGSTDAQSGSVEQDVGSPMYIALVIVLVLALVIGLTGILLPACLGACCWILFTIIVFHQFFNSSPSSSSNYKICSLSHKTWTKPSPSSTNKKPPTFILFFKFLSLVEQFPALGLLFVLFEIGRGRVFLHFSTNVNRTRRNWLIEKISSTN